MQADFDLRLFPSGRGELPDLLSSRAWDPSRVVLFKLIYQVQYGRKSGDEQLDALEQQLKQSLSEVFREKIRDTRDLRPYFVRLLKECVYLPEKYYQLRLTDQSQQMFVSGEFRDGDFAEFLLGNLRQKPAKLQFQISLRDLAVILAAEADEELIQPAFKYFQEQLNLNDDALRTTVYRYHFPACLLLLPTKRDSENVAVLNALPKNQELDQIKALIKFFLQTNYSSLELRTTFGEIADLEPYISDQLLSRKLRLFIETKTQTTFVEFLLGAAEFLHNEQPLQYTVRSKYSPQQTQAITALYITRAVKENHLGVKFNKLSAKEIAQLQPQPSLDELAAPVRVYRILQPLDQDDLETRFVKSVLNTVFATRLQDQAQNAGLIELITDPYCSYLDEETHAQLLEELQAEPESQEAPSAELQRTLLQKLSKMTPQLMVPAATSFQTCEAAFQSAENMRKFALEVLEGPESGDLILEGEVPLSAVLDLIGLTQHHEKLFQFQLRLFKELAELRFTSYAPQCRAQLGEDSDTEPHFLPNEVMNPQPMPLQSIFSSRAHDITFQARAADAIKSMLADSRADRSGSATRRAKSRSASRGLQTLGVSIRDKITSASSMQLSTIGLESQRLDPLLTYQGTRVRETAQGAIKDIIQQMDGLAQSLDRLSVRPSAKVAPSVSPGSPRPSISPPAPVLTEASAPALIPTTEKEILGYLKQFAMDTARDLVEGRLTDGQLNQFQTASLEVLRLKNLFSMAKEHSILLTGDDDSTIELLTKPFEIAFEQTPKQKLQRILTDAAAKIARKDLSIFCCTARKIFDTISWDAPIRPSSNLPAHYLNEDGAAQLGFLWFVFAALCTLSGLKPDWTQLKELRAAEQKPEQRSAHTDIDLQIEQPRARQHPQHPQLDEIQDLRTKLAELQEAKLREVAAAQAETAAVRAELAEVKRELDEVRETWVDRGAVRRDLDAIQAEVQALRAALGAKDAEVQALRKRNEAEETLVKKDSLVRPPSLETVAALREFFSEGCAAETQWAALQKLVDGEGLRPEGPGVTQGEAAWMLKHRVFLDEAGLLRRRQ